MPPKRNPGVRYPKPQTAIRKIGQARTIAVVTGRSLDKPTAETGLETRITRKEEGSFSRIQHRHVWDCRPPRQHDRDSSREFEQHPQQQPLATHSAVFAAQKPGKGIAFVRAIKPAKMAAVNRFHAKWVIAPQFL